MRTLLLMAIALCLSLPGYCQTNTKGIQTDNPAEITIVMNNRTVIPANSITLTISDLITGNRSVCQPLRKSKNTLFFRIPDPAFCAVTLYTSYKTSQKFVIAVAPNDKLKITLDQKYPFIIKFEGRNAHFVSDVCDFTQMLSLWSDDVRMAIKHKNMQQFKLYMDSVRNNLFSYIDRWTKKKTLSPSSRPALTDLLDLFSGYFLLMKSYDNSSSDTGLPRDSMLSSALLNPPFMQQERIHFAATAYIDKMIGLITDLCISQIERNDSAKINSLLTPKFVEAVGKLKASKFMRDVLKSRSYYYCKNTLNRPVDFDTLIRSIETPKILSRLQAYRDQELGK